jgi:tetratricopeptide (TPR) repeat protein
MKTTQKTRLTTLLLFSMVYQGYAQKALQRIDSYAEALLKAGKKEEAIAMYEQSIRMNPRNEPGKKALARIEGK